MTYPAIKKSPKVTLLLLLLFIIAFAIISKFAVTSADFPLLEDDSPDHSLRPFNTANPSATISPDKLYSPYAILICLSDHTILLQKNSEARIYPASLTKMRTALVAIEQLPDLQEEITIPDYVFQKLNKTDATMAGFQPNEKVRAIDLLYGVLLPSGAECCIALANHIGGSEPGFVALMNEKSAKLGMNRTHFDNTTGLHDQNNYTTVKDLGILLSYTLQNDTFRKIFCSPRYTTHSTNIHPEGITFRSTLFEKINGCSLSSGELLGGKTGYTGEAGLCLASLAKKDGKEYILVTAGAKGSHQTEQYNISDAFAVYNSLSE